MGKKVSARIKNRIKAHFVRSLMILEKKIGKSDRPYSRDSKERSNKKSS